MEHLQIFIGLKANGLSKQIQKMRFINYYLVLFIFYLNLIYICDSKESVKNKTVHSEIELNATTSKAHYADLDVPSRGESHFMESGALLRGFYVFIGISVITVFYITFRIFRLRRTRSMQAMVRKYGVITNRSDVEMVPLPLSDDEDDDTVFEINKPIQHNGR